MATTLFLLDGYALIYRAYYAFIRTPRIDSKGRDVSAIFGFALTLSDLLSRENPEHIAVALDPPGGSFRHREYPPYKAQREETPEGIRLAIPYIKSLLEAYRIPIIEVADFEADDAIGTLALQAEQRGMQVLMVTADKDYGQLVSPQVRMYRPNSKGGGFEIWGEQEIKEQFGLQSTNQMTDYLGLVGDSSDNLPGCKGIGPKTASKLLSEYPTLERVYEHLDQIGGKTASKLAEGKENSFLTKHLATIRRDVPIGLPDDLFARQPIDEARLRELYEELEFRSLLGKLNSPSPAPLEPEIGDLFASTSPPKEVVAIPASSDPLHFPIHHLDSPDKIEAFVVEAVAMGAVCFDTETSSTDPLLAELVAMSFALDEEQVYYLLLPPKRKETLKLLELLRPLMEHPEVKKIGQNIKYDIQVLLNYGIETAGVLFDTMVAHYLLAPDQRHGLDYLSEVYLSHIPMSFETMLGEQSSKDFDLRLVPSDRLAYYASEDALLTYRLYQLLATRIAEQGLTTLMEQVEMPLIYVLVAMEREGVRLDVDVLQEQSTKLHQSLEGIEREIYTLAGREFNINSSRQVGQILFDELQIEEKARKTKTGSYTTSVEILEKLRGKHPIVGKILDYRGLKKLLSTYVDSLPELLYADGKLHSSFNQTIASTGRLSSSNPNLQNIPIRTEAGREIRAAFVPSQEDMHFLSADYSQIELRLMAHMSQDPSLIEAFLNGEDIHQATAAKIYRVPLDLVSSDMRRRAKTANFGIIYGISAFGLSERLSIPRGEATELIKGYFASYPGVAEYMERIKESARQQGYVSTLLGRRSYLRDINSGNAVVRGYAERNAINAPLQGTAADIIKIAMIRIHKEITSRGLRSRLLLQVHDELNFEVPTCELELMRTLVSETMTQAYTDLAVPLLVEVGVGKNWLEAH